MLNNILQPALKPLIRPILQGAGSKPWTPLDKLGALWLDGDLSTMVDNGSGLVNRWNDKFGNVNYAQQFTGSRQPLNTGTLNSLPAMIFNNDFMTMNTEVIGIRTVIIVTDNLSGSVSALFSGTDGSHTFIATNSSDGNYDISVDGGGGFSGTVRWCGNTGVNGTNVNLGNTNAENEGSSIWSIVFDQAIKINEIARLNGSLYLTGNIASLRAYTDVLTAEEIDIQEGFEGHRYDLLDKFPASHPHKYDGTLFGYPNGTVGNETGSGTG